ncbi:MAG: hypothetical protein QXY62_01030 [Candidatus Altiarchaeota archaeon]
MPIFQIEIVKDKGDEFDIEFSERIYKHAEEENAKILESMGWETEKKSVLFKDMKDIEVANMLCEILIKRGIDAYTYERHSLVPKYALHISAKNAKKEFIKAVDELSKEWENFRKSVMKKMKKI